MARIDLTRKTRWRRVAKSTGLAAVCSNNSTRQHYLEYEDGDAVGFLAYDDTGWRIWLCGKGQGIVNKKLMGSYPKDKISEAKQFLSKAYKAIASAKEDSKDYELKKTLGWVEATQK